MPLECLLAWLRRSSLNKFLVAVGDNYVADIETTESGWSQDVLLPHGSSSVAVRRIGQEQKFLRDADARFPSTSISTILARNEALKANSENAFRTYGYQVLEISGIFPSYAAHGRQTEPTSRANAMGYSSRAEGIFLAQHLLKRSSVPVHRFAVCFTPRFMR